MATTADFRTGLCIELHGELYTIVSYQHVKPGKGGAYLRTKLKHLTKGKVVEHTFNVGSKVKSVRIERRGSQYLYKDSTVFYFMDNESFETVSLAIDRVPFADLMKEGQEVFLMTHGETGEILACELPPFVTLKVTYAEPGYKGDTVTKTLKPATVESGANLQVPLFINTEDLIKVDTRDYSYVERVKKE